MKDFTVSFSAVHWAGWNDTWQELIMGSCTAQGGLVFSCICLSTEASKCSLHTHCALLHVAQWSQCLIHVHCHTSIV